MIPQPVPAIAPHRNAPMFEREDAGEVLSQVLREALSGRFPDDERFIQLIRQAGFVNEWFFLRVVAAFAGPFESLTNHLHLDMCNFFQRNTNPGDRAAMFIPRSMFKSTTATEGGSAWKLVRNPDERIRISGATYDRAQGFMTTVKGIFDSNELFAACYPEFVPPKNQKRWNDKELVLPNRSKNFREPSVYPGGAGGSAEGLHFSGHVLDDPFGEKVLNAMRGSGLEMENIKNWFFTNLPSLLLSPKQSWSFVVGTRYAVDDLYGEIIERAYAVCGGEMPGFEENPEGQWKVYYRSAIEGGESIFPENFSLEDFKQIAKDDYWTWATQYENNPQGSGISEFVNYSFAVAGKELDVSSGETFLEWTEYDEERKPYQAAYPLSDFDVIMAVDPAGTEKMVSAKTSKSAVGVIATHHSGKHVLIDLRADFVSPTVMFDWMFEFGKKYGKYLRATFLEANAGFKVLGAILRKEQNERGVYLGLRTFPSIGDKDARIRNTLDPVFREKKLLVCKGFEGKVEEETKGFPQSRKKDILDMLSSGISNTIIPEDPAEEAKILQERNERRRKQGKNLAGYG